MEVNRKRKKKKAGKEKSAETDKKNRKSKSTEKEKSVIRRIPKTAAISIKGSIEGFSYAKALKKARTEISLKDLEISMLKIRKDMNGATIIEIRRR